jgi:hypothetical protein
MSIGIKQVPTGLLALAGMGAGLRAAPWRRQFRDSFPGCGPRWVAVPDPRDERRVRGVCRLYLATTIISVGACVRPRAEVLPTVAPGWLVFSILRAIRHMSRLDMRGTADEAGDIIALFGVIVLAALLVAPVNAAQRLCPSTLERQ